MSSKEAVFRLDSSITGSVSLDVKVTTVGDGAFDTTVEFYWPGEELCYGRLSLAEILIAARRFNPISFIGIRHMESLIPLSPVAVLQCACFAQELQVKALQDHFASMQCPNVVMEINGGVINEVRSDRPVSLIVLDEDIEGADQDGIVRVNGSDWYLRRISVDQPEAALHHSYVSAVLGELLNQPQKPQGERL